MPWHEWGSEFDFNGLAKAERWVKKAFRRATGQNMCTKEKYGTIRYEFDFLWLKSYEDTDIFLEILKRATVKFPDFAGEIVSDVIPSILYAPTGRRDYYKGYFDAILMVKHQSKWETY